MRIHDVVYVHQLRDPTLLRWHTRLHAHKPGEYELHFFLAGSGRFLNHPTRYLITPGSLHLTYPEQEHAIAPAEEDRGITFFAILFSPTPELEELLQTTEVRALFPRNIGPHQRLLFEDLAAGFSHKLVPRQMAAAHQLHAFLWQQMVPTNQHGKPAHFNIHIERAIGIMQEHLYTGITMGAVAERIGITQPHLTRTFHQILGISPARYYRHLRMEAAASLLTNSTTSIKEIAWHMGFSNQFHFSRSFFSVAQVSPRAFRENYFRANPTGYAQKLPY